MTLGEAMNANNQTNALNAYQDWQGGLQNYGCQVQNQLSAEQLGQLIQAQTCRKDPMADGTKPIVICNGTIVEAKDLADAEAKAEDLAHKHSMPAYVLKPITKISPKRDTVRTDLP